MYTIKYKKSPAVVADYASSNGTRYMTTPPRSHALGEDWPHEEQLEVIGIQEISEGKIAEGKFYLEEAFRLGNLYAGQALGYGYSAGWFGEPDYERSLTYTRKLVQKGFADAMSDYSLAYELGLGVKKSKRWAKYWQDRAIAAGSMIAKSNRGIDLLFGDEAIRDEERGVRLCFEAAVNGQEMAIHAMGRCYESGIVVRKNLKRAFQCYREAVENGAGAFAEHSLAICFRKGIGVEPDLEEAEKWDKAALEHGYKS